MVVHHCECSPYHRIVQFQMVDVMLHEFNFRWQKLKSKGGVQSASVRTLEPPVALWIASALGPWRKHCFWCHHETGLDSLHHAAQGKIWATTWNFFSKKKKKKKQVAQCRLLSRVPGQCRHISNHNLQGPFLSSLSPSQTFKSCILNSSCFLWNAVNWLGMTRVSGGE